MMASQGTSPGRWLGPSGLREGEGWALAAKSTVSSLEVVLALPFWEIAPWVPFGHAAPVRSVLACGADGLATPSLSSLPRSAQHGPVPLTVQSRAGRGLRSCLV